MTTTNKVEATLEDELVKHWHPWDWRAPVEDVVARIEEGDAVHNPVYRVDCDRSRKLADEVDAALAKRGLKLDYTNTCTGYVVRGDAIAC